MNRKKLKNRIRERGEPVIGFAKKCGVLPICFVLKLYGFGEFRLWEINRIVRLLDLSHEEAGSIFFGLKVS